jgi:hypothetical protein
VLNLAVATISVATFRGMDPVKAMEEYVRSRLRKEIASGPRGAAAALARTLGTSGAHLSNITAAHPKATPGEDLRRRCAEHWGLTPAELEAVATGQEPIPHQPTVVTDDKYPERAEATQRLAGTISAAALEHVKGLRLAADRRWSVIDWVDELTTAERRFGTGRRRVGETTCPVE